MKSLKAKISIPVVCLVVGAQFTTGLFIVSRVQEAMYHENHNLGMALTSDLAHVCTSSLISKDLFELRTYIRSTMTQEYVTQAMVVDNDCRIIMHNNLAMVGETYKGTCAQPGQPQFSEHNINQAGETEMDILVPIEVGGTQLGSAILSYSHSGIKKEITTITRDILLVVIIASGVATLFAILLAEYIVRPIRHLCQVAEELGRGVFDFKKMDEEYSDEIGDLKRSFYDMAGKLEKEVCYDTLTSLNTRNVFQIRLTEECFHCLRHNCSFAVLMLDVDHFKKVNDTHGHRVGDEVLQHIAATLKGQTRGCDCPARYGGEEFIVLLPETNRLGALYTAEKIRQTVESESFLLPDGSKIPLTISIGIAMFPDDSTNYSGLIELADQAMYEAKKRGRNSVVQASLLKKISEESLGSVKITSRLDEKKTPERGGVSP
ncbi:MAG: diguanylate cyclase [Proteobacteria bacterium]|nr:diguanylate cyclase [Desulfobulbaceae bacterium]MBU4153384.1 diguanylate cyclase [Pseudomonadota bacterium]